jgi:hypothetical protein
MATICRHVVGNNALVKEPFGEQRVRAFHPSHCPADALEKRLPCLGLYESFWVVMAATKAGAVANSVDAAWLCKTREVVCVE